MTDIDRIKNEIKAEIAAELEEVKIHVAKIETALGFVQKAGEWGQKETSQIHTSCEKRLAICNQRFGKTEQLMTKYAVILGVVVAALVKGLDWIIGKL